MSEFFQCPDCGCPDDVAYCCSDSTDTIEERYNEKTSFVESVEKLIHYPECWDTAAYPTLLDALTEIHQGCTECKEKYK